MTVRSQFSAGGICLRLWKPAIETSRCLSPCESHTRKQRGEGTFTACLGFREEVQEDAEGRPSCAEGRPSHPTCPCSCRESSLQLCPPSFPSKLNTSGPGEQDSGFPLWRWQEVALQEATPLTHDTSVGYYSTSKKCQIWPREPQESVPRGSTSMHCMKSKNNKMN